MIISPIPGVVYKFSFSPGYEIHDGTYLVTATVTYDECISSGGDIKADFFTPANRDEDFDNHLSDIRTSKIMKLQRINLDGSEFYAPVTYLSGTPDHNVTEYKKLGMISYIGVVKDAEQLEFMKDTFTEQVLVTTGIMTEPQFMYTGSTWLTEDEFITIQNERDLSAIQTVNYFSENIKLISALADANTKILAYEELIRQLQTSEDTDG